jgi:hypothetical protein
VSSADELQPRVSDEIAPELERERSADPAPVPLRFRSSRLKERAKILRVQNLLLSSAYRDQRRTPLL